MWPQQTCKHSSAQEILRSIGHLSKQNYFKLPLSLQSRSHHNQTSRKNQYFTLDVWNHVSFRRSNDEQAYVCYTYFISFQANRRLNNLSWNNGLEKKNPLYIVHKRNQRLFKKQMINSFKLDKPISIPYWLGHASSVQFKNLNSTITRSLHAWLQYVKFVLWKKLCSYKRF